MATQAELEAQLTEVDAAVSTILTGSQAGGHSDRVYRFADLETLQKMQNRLRTQIERAKNPIAARSWP